MSEQGARRARAVDGRLQFGCSLSEYARGGPLALIAARKSVTLPPTDALAAVEPIGAILEQDQWVVLCPDCRQNAQLVWLDEPKFMCAYCFNAVVGGLWRPVALPDAARRSRIESIVGHRPFPHQRNWRGETLTQLRRENADEGDPVPDQGAT